MFAFAEDGQGQPAPFGDEGSVFSLDYSFVTLATLGYGDIVPTTQTARMFAAVEAIMGQLYRAAIQRCSLP